MAGSYGEAVTLGSSWERPLEPGARPEAYSGAWRRVRTWTTKLRAAAFAYLDRLRARGGDRISYRDLEAFELEGQRVPLIQRMRGIRVVSGLEANERRIRPRTRLRSARSR